MTSNEHSVVPPTGGKKTVLTSLIATAAPIFGTLVVELMKAYLSSREGKK
jgi:hypothetical protein